jgi:preprotein translocase subunit SecA
VVLSRVLRIGEGKSLRRCEAIVAPTNALEDAMRARSDAELRQYTDTLRQRLFEPRHDGGDLTDDDLDQRLDDLLPEAFALVREASRRVRGQRHFDVQLIGGAAMHYGMIAEMKTGEGKTLAATLPSFLNALTGKGVHVVTVNDYLVKRDAEWMGLIHRFLGLEVGMILASMTPAQRRPNYAADITYGTNNEFGFDYLRDNMALRIEDVVQRPDTWSEVDDKLKRHYFAIVDEADSILIDEARTPLIISGPAEQGARWYQQFARLVPRLSREPLPVRDPQDHPYAQFAYQENGKWLLPPDYEVDEAKQTIAVTEKGVARVEELLGVDNLYDSLNTPLVHHLQNAIRAQELYRRDDEYIVRDGEVLIVDEFTGRVLPGRRYSEGLHQAIEAKEGVRIKEENQTYATITLQNYFRMYRKLAGMTGTAKTEAAEFEHIYKLGVVEVPTNRPMIRDDQPDVIYKTEEAKYDALVEDIVAKHDRQQPILIGTTSIEKSERVSRLLDKRGIRHQVLNAKHHEREAHIIAQAGRLGAVTVATNMAGRGVDIMLGGNVEYLAEEALRARGMDPTETDPEVWAEALQAEIQGKKAQVAAEHDEVVERGGLAVIGTERHESRRIDNQLRGRSGRQGDPGESLFFLSLEDDLMRMFATKTVSGLMDRLKLEDDVPISHKMVTRAIANAQRQVEQQNFERRKNVLKYDEVLNRQREVIYDVRRRILEGEDLSEQTLGFLGDVAAGLVAQHAPPEQDPEEWDLDGLLAALSTTYPTQLTKDAVDLDTITYADLESMVLDDAEQAWKRREEELGPELLKELQRAVLLTVLDRRWREHLYEMDSLQDGIGLRAIGQRDPLTEYQREGFDMFQRMQEGIKAEAVAYVFNASVQIAEKAEEQRQQAPSPTAKAQLSSAATEDAAVAKPAQPARSGPAKSAKIPRNAPCPCGSGKKYKLCHGRSGATTA